MKRSKAPALFKRYRRAKWSGELFHGDAIAFLRSLDDETADVVFLDPPFNLGKQYGSADDLLDRKTAEQYERWMETVLYESVRILRPGGALFLYHVPLWATRFGSILLRLLNLRHWIAVSMKNGFVRGRNLYPAHYALLYFTKGGPRTFKRPKLPPAKCRHCGGLVKDYGGYRDIITKKGLNLSDVWDDLSPVRHRSNKLRPQNQLPMKFAERIVNISGRRGGLLVDPFAGTGSVVMAAIEKGMRFKACDLVKRNCSIITARIMSRPVQRGT
jgi:site-specific DNA-methyltransferase (adenine-specific)